MKKEDLNWPINKTNLGNISSTQTEGFIYGGASSFQVVGQSTLIAIDAVWKKSQMRPFTRYNFPVMVTNAHWYRPFERFSDLSCFVLLSSAKNTDKWDWLLSSPVRNSHKNTNPDGHRQHRTPPVARALFFATANWSPGSSKYLRPSPWVSVLVFCAFRDLLIDSYRSNSIP